MQVLEVLGPIESISEAILIHGRCVAQGVFFGMKHAAPIMKQQGSDRYLHGLGCWITSGKICLCGNKAAVIHLTKSVALELGQQGIRVNAICPEIGMTPLAHGPLDEERRQKFRDRFGRISPSARRGSGRYSSSSTLSRIR